MRGQLVHWPPQTKVPTGPCSLNPSVSQRHLPSPAAAQSPALLPAAAQGPSCCPVGPESGLFTPTAPGNTQPAHPPPERHMLTAWKVTTPATEPLSRPAGWPSRTGAGGERGREQGSWWERRPQHRDSKNFDVTSTEHWGQTPTRVCAPACVCVRVRVPVAPSNNSVLPGEACFPPNSCSSSAY